MKNLKRFLLAALPIAALACAPIGCTDKDSNQVRQDTKQQVEQTKQEAQQFGAQAKAEAQKGAADVVAAAQGLKAGINAKTAPAVPGQTADGKMDLNSASRDQLLTLPGVGVAGADAIIADRPYSDPQDTVSKGALTQRQYARISGRVGVS